MNYDQAVPMPISRRQFIQTATATAAAIPLAIRAQQSTGEIASPLFRHGVASGDPLTDRVILWTRITPRLTGSGTGPIDVAWQIASDEALTLIVARGTAPAPGERDFTVKVDAGGLRPGRTYYYAFTSGGERSPIGRTRTLPERGNARMRLASVCCSNYPAGYFNVYRCLANRPDLDAVVHLGDYIYEFANGRYGDGTASGRVPVPTGEAVTLDDYRHRYATYRSDIDLQDAHRLHPFIVVWDDHELANDAWSGGAGNHAPSQGDWQTRRAGAYKAYLEWMPVRESTQPGIHLYRAFRFGDLTDLIMLDTRGLRDQQVAGNDAAALADPRRSLFGAEQEAWFFDQLRASQRADTRWRLLGQQILFAPLSPPALPVQRPDVWDGYPAERTRVLDVIEHDRISNVVILTGDIHSSWALDVPRNPWGSGYDGNGAGSLAVELVTPAVSSPPFFSTPAQRDAAKMLQPLARHLKYLEGEHRGYVLIDVSRDRLQADWYHVPTVDTRTSEESKAASFVCEQGSSRLARA
ncbi:MAG TPA: alkaline phosphatase D family protein [Vicinamibacterales bacterium]|nr:alkaline phosphatase D family protein [Vicinamibacterales bacterium]